VTGVRREAATVLIALLAAMVAGSVLILLFGQSPARVYGALVGSTWGSGYGVGQVLFKATPLVFTGLSVALAFRAGLFNIGAEGQLLVGGMATALAGAALPPGVPAAIAVPLALVSGFVAGAAWGAVPGALRAFTGAHEVINTIMMNFLAGALVLWIGNRFAFEPETTHTAPIAPAAELPTLGLGGSAANLSVVLAALAALAVWWLLGRSRPGFELRAFGKSPSAAENAGVAPRPMIIWTMAAAGGLAGLVGANFVLGYKHYFEEGMSRGAGFMGIAVALLGRGHPVGVLGAALLIATLSHGGLAVNAMVPKELIDVLQAVIILAVAATAATLGRGAART
jgi:general nucleoside transport system permease protein